MNWLPLFTAMIVALGDGKGFAQEIILRDGRILQAKEMRRNEDNLVVALDGSGSELTIAVSQIDRISFPVQAQLAESAELLVAGKEDDAIAKIEAVVNQQVDFRDIAGNHWTDAALTLAYALNHQGRGLEAQGITEKVSKSSDGGETLHGASVQSAFILLGRNDDSHARELVEQVLRESRRNGNRAGAFLIKGECLRREQKWEDSLLCFLQVPVFYPEEKILLPPALLGKGRALLGLEDLPGAREAFEELRSSYPGSSEAKLATQELERVLLREQSAATSR